MRSETHALILHHEKVQAQNAAPERWILFLHGIYGAGRNWGSVAKRVAERRPDWGVVLVDLREHGRSQGFPPPHTLDACAEDLRALVAGEGIRAEAVLGHSFGGKVGLVYAREPAAPLAQLWMIDSTPEARRPSGSAWAMLEALRALPGPFGSREEAVGALEGAGVATAVAQWMTTNLERDDQGRLVWRIDPEAMEALLRDFFDTDAWDVIETPPGATEVHVVKATESSVLDEAACRRVEAAGERGGPVHLHRVDGGHWLNADNPDALVALLTDRLPR